MKYITLLFSGIIFGIGLVLSGMTNPLKVQNFLDLFGLWDPSLAFVMGGAIFISYLIYQYLEIKFIELTKIEKV